MEGDPSLDPMVRAGELRIQIVGGSLLSIAAAAIVVGVAMGGAQGAGQALCGTAPTILIGLGLRGGSRLARWLFVLQGLLLAGAFLLVLRSGMRVGMPLEHAALVLALAVVAGGAALFVAFDPSIRRFFDALDHPFRRPSTSEKTRAPER